MFMWNTIFTWDLFAIEKHSEKRYEKALRPPWVRLLLKNKEGLYLLTKEFRTEAGSFDYRLPWGKVFDTLEDYLLIRWDQKKLDDAVLKAAKTEAKEEAWIDVIQFLRIFHQSKAGASVEWDLYYVSGNILEMSEQALAGDELTHGIEIWFYNRAQILVMIKSWEIQEDRTVGVLCRYL